MGKIIRLTESDLTKIVKKVIIENEKKEVQKEKAKEIVNDPSFLRSIREKLNNLSDEQIEEIENQLENLGVSRDSSIEQVNNRVESLKSDVGSEEDYNSEMSEDFEPKKQSTKHKIADTLNDIGASSMTNFTNVVASSGQKSFWGQAIAIGTNMLVSALLVGLARVLKK
jgi:polyhydroxyalkanoate synthesis regulator phasin